MHTQNEMYTSLRQAVDESPEDWAIRLVLADYCEEEGNLLEAEFWRWTYDYRWAAYPSVDHPGYWKWWNAIGCKSASGSYLPVEIHRALEGYSTLSFIDLTVTKPYSSNAKADDALFAAWKRVHHST